MRDSLPEDLAPHEAALYHVVREGLSLFDSRHGRVRAGLSVRSERSLIHDCMVEEAQKVFSPGQWMRRGNLFLLALGPYRIKLKKFGPHLITSSYPTQAVFDFLAQQVRKLFDLDVENLQLGYVPLGLSVTDYPIWIAKPRVDGRPEWEHELTGGSAAALMDLPKTNPNIPPVTRVKAKPAKFTAGSKDKRE
jgi:hypothetical protein